MPINVFGNSNSNDNSKIDTSLFVQKPYLRHNYIESNLEEDIDLKNQYRIKNLVDPINLQDACNKNFVKNIFKNDIDFNDVKLENIKFVKVNYAPAHPNHLTPKVYVDNTINESTLVRNHQNKEFNKNNLTNINSITLNTQAVNDNQVITKAYVDQFHQKSERSRRNLGNDFYNESNDIVKTNQDDDFNDNKLTNINSITINNNPTDDKHVSNKKYIDDQLDKDTLVRLNDDSNDRYLKVNIKNSTYNLPIYNKILLTDTTILKYPNNGGYLLPSWRIFCNDRNNNVKIQNFIRSTKTNSPTGNSGAIVTPPIGDSFMYFEFSGNNFGSNVFCSWERIDIIQISNITFYYNRFTIQGDLRAMGRFRIQILTKDNVWLTNFNEPKNDQFSNAATDWTILSLNITDENYGIKLIYDQIETAHADMCFSNISITHSIY